MTNKVAWTCAGLTLLAALGYLLMGIGTIHPGDLTGEDGPPGFAWIMLGGYVVGGLLILLRKRGLWITGVILNALVIVGFTAMYAGKPAVMFSVPGLLTKIPQILLEVGLVYLLVKAKPEKSAVPAK